ncbi:hypothetical protein AGMMS49992_10490 [Clostridia bacterium]|nr:hypothetical protein AGMMS49992_10490 [Clostridia bacterium]
MPHFIHQIIPDILYLELFISLLGNTYYFVDNDLLDQVKFDLSHQHDERFRTFSGILSEMIHIFFNVAASATPSFPHASNT